VSPVHLRRTLATAAAALAVTAALAACGFNYPTDRVNNITAGANYRDGTVNVLNAVIVSKNGSTGTFIATFVNNSQTKTVSLTGMTGDGTVVAQVSVEPFPIPPQGLVNLADGGGIAVQGSFTLGQFVALTLTFDDGETVAMKVPVVQDAGDYSGLDTASPSPTASPSDTSSPSDASSPSSGSSASDTSSPSASAS
jgi:copper(I)-binding protein